jgi:hypothetical protein
LIICDFPTKNISETEVKLSGTNVQMMLFRNLEEKKMGLFISEQIPLLLFLERTKVLEQLYAKYLLRQH